MAPLTSGELDQIQADILTITRDVGKLVKSVILQRSKKIESKLSDCDMVTETDTQCENMIREFVAAKYPSHKLLAEESAESGDRLGNEPTWIVDPIDGTMNFAKTNPFTCVSIGFSVDKVMQIGSIYMPFYDELFHARLGKGAFMNDVVIMTGENVPLTKATVNTGFNFYMLKCLRDESLPDKLRKQIEDVEAVVKYNFNSLLGYCLDYRRTGASALECCWVACGRLDSSYEIGNKEWDLAAGCLIVQEAGGHACCIDGTPMDIGARNYLVTCSDSLAKEIVEKIKPSPHCIRQLEADLGTWVKKSR